MAKETNRALNFNPGPAALPFDVLDQAREELVDYQGKGLSVMEMSHRSPEYEAIHNDTMEQVRKLLQVPDSYKILLLQGGASLQFGMVPMNFLSSDRSAGYVLTGSWSEKALKEAKTIGQAYTAATTEDEGYRRIPEEIEFQKETSYVHITSNNTIYGTQWGSFPDTGEIPLIADMSSDIFSKPFDVNDFGLLYAGAQKNLGPSGVTLAIVRDELAQSGNDDIPTLMKYTTHIGKNSLYHTPPTFGIYMLGLVTHWIRDRGGLSKMQEINAEKANLLYDVIDNSDGFYRGHAEKESRSHMNVTFRLPSEELEKAFLAQAKEEGFLGLNGHRSVGGCRASIYNAVPLESCRTLRDFMVTFQKQNG